MILVSEAEDPGILSEGERGVLALLAILRAGAPEDLLEWTWRRAMEPEEAGGLVPILEVLFPTRRTRLALLPEARIAFAWDVPGPPLPASVRRRIDFTSRARRGLHRAEIVAPGRNGGLR